MAIFSGKYRNIAIAVVILTCLAKHGRAEEAVVKNPGTQPSTEVFDVKTKNLPPANNASGAVDIPLPDFQAFDDDKYLDSLADNKKDNIPLPDVAMPSPAAPPAVPPEAILPPVPDLTPPASPDNATGNAAVVEAVPADKVSADVTKIAVPATDTNNKTATKLGNATPNEGGKTPEDVPSIAENTKQAEVPANPASASPVAGDIKPDTATEASSASNSMPDSASSVIIPPAEIGAVPTEMPDLSASHSRDSPAQLSPNVVQPETGIAEAPVPEPVKTTNANGLSAAEQAAYAELKKNLLAFMAGKDVAKADIGKDIPNATTPDNVISAPDGVANAGGPTTATPSPAVVAEQNKPSVPSDFEDFLELDHSSDSKQANASIPAPEGTTSPSPVNPPAQEIAAAPDNQSPDTKPQEIAKPVGVMPGVNEAKTPDDKNISPPGNIAEAPSVDVDKPKDISADSKDIVATNDKVEALPPKKHQEVVIKEDEVKPAEKIQLSDADKAYIQLLEKKREALPESKRLSEDTMAVMDSLSEELMPTKSFAKNTPKYIKVEHGDAGKPGLEEDGVIKSQNQMNISVRKGGKEADFEKSRVKLGKAYKALLVGQTAASISIYKDVLDKEPENMDAMFGLATAYHKNNQFEQAREIYTKILKKEPANKEALNNFLVLVAEEAPEDALIELEKLERINSDFSPIAAQIAMINLRLGKPEKSARYLRRAILLSPENISYKYNLAVVYDNMENEPQALQLYHKVIEAVRSGAVINGSVDKVVERAEYLEAKLSKK